LLEQARLEEGEEDYLDYIKERAFDYAEACKAAMLEQVAHPRAEHLFDEVKRRGKTRVYQKCFDRRLRILIIIAIPCMSWDNLADRTFPRIIDWERAVNLWNYLNPHDNMVKANLKSEFHQAKAEPYLREVFFDTVLREIAGLVNEAFELFHANTLHIDFISRQFHGARAVGYRIFADQEVSDEANGENMENFRQLLIGHFISQK